MISKSKTLLAAAAFAAISLQAQIFGQSATTVPSPTPTPAPLAAPSPAFAQTLEGLRSKIKERLAAPILRRGQVGVKIVSLNTGKIVFEQNADKYFMPASNMKNFTVAAAIERLSPDFRFVTSVYAPSAADAGGVINGDVRVYGRGDVSFSTLFTGGDPAAVVDDLANKIVQAGIKRIEGSLIGDDSYFVGNPVPGTWEYEDLQWYYGAEISALSLNDNTIGLSVTPGPVGYSCSASMRPANTIYRVTNQCLTVPAGSPRTLTITKAIDRNELLITGELPVGSGGFTGQITVSRPAELFVSLLKQRLGSLGVVVTGQTRTERVIRTPDQSGIEIVRRESPPLALIAAKTMKPSQNMYTETLLYTLGEDLRAKNRSNPQVANKESSELGIEAVKSFMAQIGAEPDELLQYDGSGLSRHNLVTPNAVIRVYTYMAKQSRYAAAWRDSLTIGGVDGTLANRFKGTRAAANMRGKTGTIDQVSALSGYVTTAGGDQLVVSFLVNGVAATGDRVSMIDDIVISLANFGGKLDQ